MNPKPSISGLCIGLLPLLLSACATSAQARRTAPASPVVDEAEAYVAAVEYIAHRRGVQVIWVNPPRRTP